MSESKGVALITGSSQGIGRAIALRLAADGFDIALNDIPSKAEQLEVVAKEIQAIGRRSGVFTGDVSDENSVKGMIEGTVKHLGSLDVCVANAGVVTSNSIVDTSMEEWDRTFAINARGTFLCYKYASIQMISQNRGGRIIRASSVSGKRGRRNGVTYCGTKFAVRGMTQAAALDLGKYGITVNAYAPGPIETSMLEELLSDDPDKSKHVEFLGNIPLGKAGQPNDVAGLVSYLASKDAAYVTGQTVSFHLLQAHKKCRKLPLIETLTENID